jgi:hypothetical protein
MPRAVLLCSTIVAAFQLQTAAIAATTEHVPLTPAVAALAGRVGLDVKRDRSRLVPELIRILYASPNSKPPSIAQPTPGGGTAVDGMSVDVPLTHELWAEAVFHRSVSPDHLLAAILADKRASLLCRGLAGADDETLEYYAAHPLLLSYFYERAVPVFAAFGPSVAVHDGRVAIPGGTAAQALWEAVLHAGADSPEAFIRALLQEQEPHSAYLYDVLATAAPDARAFALGLWIRDPALRLQRFQALVLSVRTAFREWHIDELPLARPLNDLAVVLLRLRVGADGEPQPPAERQFWSLALGVSPNELPGAAAANGHTRIDAGWLIQAIAGDMYVRGDRLDQLAFGQRVFGRRPDGAGDAAAQVVHELPSRRMLLLGLERLGISAPDVYVAALRVAREAQDGGGERFWTETQLQGSLALLLRMHDSGSIDDAQAESLVRSLVAVPLTGGEYRGQLAAWIDATLSQRLPPGETVEARVIAAVAGGRTPGDPHIEWEGQEYRLDLGRAERLRIQEIRRRQGGPDVDLALRLATLGRRALRADSGDAAAGIAESVRRLVSDSGVRLVRSPSTLFAPGVPAPRDGHDWLLRIADGLERSARGGEPRRAVRDAESLLNVADVTLGEALVTLVYAVHLGDPDGPALLGANVALRHDFGFARRDSDFRIRQPWAIPRQDFQPGVPWHVVGSLVGLDIALAPLNLRRLSMDGLDTPPRLPSIERDGFAVNVALLNARRLTDADRDRLVDALRRGENRLQQLRADPGSLDRLADEISLDGWRRRSLRWVLQNEPDSIENQLSLAELVALGGDQLALDGWGANALLSFGCACTHFPEPRLWRVLAGRVQAAMMAAASVEMNLELARRLSVMRLPASLLPSILQTAMQSFVDTVAPTDPNDMWSLVRYARGLQPTSVADYIAAAATLDGPLVSIDEADAGDP